MSLRTALVLGVAALAAACGPKAAPDAPRLAVSFADPAWTGGKIPAGQHCALDGGAGMTPPLLVEGIPAGASEILVEFNDESYQPLSYDGGHGIIGYAHDGGPTARLAAVPAQTDALGVPGARVVKGHRARGRFASPGYIPPCSGGRGNLYSADVKALAPDGTVIGFGEISLGRY